MDRGDRFSVLYQAHYSGVLRYAMRRTDAETARDVVAETFLVAWRRLDAIPADAGEIEPWLYGVARLVLANSQRSRHRAERVTARLGQENRDIQVPDTANAVAERARLAHALSSLSPTDQEVLRLVGWEELDLAGAALAMGCSRSAMAVRLHRARRRLQRALQAADSQAAEHSGPGRARPASDRRLAVGKPMPAQQISRETP